MAPPRIITREEAGLAEPRSGITRRPPRVVRGVIVHHEAAEHDFEREDPLQVWRDVQAFHMGPRGWSDISYEAGVWQDGTVLLGRDAGVRGAHTAAEKPNPGWDTDWNTLYNAICWLGHGDTQNMSDEAWASVVWYWQLNIWASANEGRVEAGVALATEFLLHGECIPTACPGASPRERMNNHRMFLAGLGQAS